MSCNVINPAKVSLNGSSSAYGGSISNVSLNFGLLSAGTNATVTLVGSSMSNPTNGDGFTLGIMGLDLNMKIAGYTFSSSATGATTLRLTLKDKSHEILDNNFIVRREEVPAGLEGPIDYIGTKYGTLPNDIAIDMGILVPASDTMWGDLREYFKTLQIVYNLFYKSWGANFMTDEDVDDHVKAANGKTIWNSDELQDILVKHGVLEGDVPAGAFQLDGSLREVVMGVANTLGAVVYWDCTSNSLVFSNAISSSAGSAVLADLSSKCEVVSSSSSADFTTSLSVGAIGSFSTNSSDTQQQKSQGGKMAKFYRGTPLTPTFHYPKCSTDEDKKNAELFEIDINDNDMQKAFYASWHPEFYAMYALQTVLKAKFDRGDKGQGCIPFLEGPLLNGRDNQLKVATSNEIQDSVIIDPCSSYTINSVFKNYYVGEGACSTTDCCSSVFAIYFKENSPPIRNLSVLAGENDADDGKGWNAKPNQVPFKVAGYWKDFEFEDGYHIIRTKADTSFSTVLNNEGLDGSADKLRLYLNAIFRFQNCFHVIKDGTNLRSAVDADDNFYSFYITQDSQGPGLAITAPNGFAHRPVDPYLSVEECGIPELSELLKACELMYKGTCELAADTAIIDWIRVLDSNGVKNFMEHPSRWQKARRGPFSQKTLDATCSSHPQMHLFIQEAPEDPFIGSSAGTDNCTGGSIAPNAEMGIWEKIGQLALSGGTNAFFKTFDDKFQSFAITDTDIGGTAEALAPRDRSQSKVKAWIDIDGSMGTLTTGPGPQYIGAAAMPAGGTWTSKLNRGISIDAADIARQAGDLAQKYGGGNCYNATAENEGKAYSDFMIASMIPELQSKVNAHQWTDTSSAASQTMTVVLGDDLGDITLPTIEEGLESLSITNSNGKLEISISVGNRFERESKRAMFDLMASVPSLQHVAAPNIPDTFIGGASPKLVQISKGLV